MKKFVALILSIVMILTLFVGCSSGQKETEAPEKGTAAPEKETTAEAETEAPAKDKLRFIYVDPAAANSYWVDLFGGLEAAGKKLDVEIVHVGPDQVDQMKQIEDIEAAVAEKPDGIITMALNAPAFTDPVNYAVDHGVPVVLLDGDAPESKRAFFCGVDCYQQGLDVGKEIVERVGTDAKIGIVTAGLDIEIINDRIDGLKKVCEENPGMEIVAIEDSHGDTVVAGDKATAMLQTYPEINVMIAAGAADVPGVGLAIDTLDLKDKVTGIAFNDDPQGLEYLKSGVYDFILCSLPSEEGYAAVEALYNYVTGKLPEGGPDTVYMRSVVITAENADTYKNIEPPTFESLLEAAK